MAFFRIQLTRSAIGLPSRVRGVLDALGLKRRMAVVYQPVTRDIAGMIMKVKELVNVEEVDQRLSKVQVKELRKPNPGFYVESKATAVPVSPSTSSSQAKEGISGHWEN